MANKAADPLLQPGAFDRLTSWDVPVQAPNPPARRPSLTFNPPVLYRASSNPWATLDRGGSSPTPSFERWARTARTMGKPVPSRIGRSSLLSGFVSTLANAARHPSSTADFVAEQLRQSLARMDDHAPHKEERGLQATLKFFILHYMLLFAFQALVQVAVTAVEVVNQTLWNEDVTVKVVLIAIDWTLVLMLLVELMSEIWVSGIRRFLSILEHKIDLVILAFSVTFCLLDTFHKPEDGTVLEHLYDGTRMSLRLLRLWVFVDQIYMLLSHPLQVMASVYETAPATDEGCSERA